MDKLRIPPAEIKKAEKRVDQSVISALRFSLQRLEVLQGELLSRAAFSSEFNGFNMRLAVKPLSSVGCYVPGGRAIYPSTMLMTAGLARIAGVPRVVLCTPPDSTGTVNDALSLQQASAKWMKCTGAAAHKPSPGQPMAQIQSAAWRRLLVQEVSS